MSKELKEIEAQIQNEIKLLNKRLAEKSLAEFTKQAWHIIEPETKLEWNWHLDTLCAYLEATTMPSIHITRLIINVPPGSLKSVLVSVMFPAWLWIKYPAKRVLGVSNAQDLAIRDSRRTKQIVTDDWYTSNWDLALKEDQSAKTNYENVRGGFRISLGITANITGKRGDCFTSNTLVDTEFGPTAITNVKVGDKVWSWNNKLQCKELQPVEALYSSEVSRPVVRLHLNSKKDGSGKSIHVDCTPEHKFYTQERGLVEAKDLGLSSNKSVGFTKALNSLLGVPKCLGQPSSSTARIHNEINFGLRKILGSCISIWGDKVSSCFHPGPTSSNFTDSTGSNTVGGSAVSSAACTNKYISNVLHRKRVLTSGKSTMVNRVSGVFLSSTIFDIGKDAVFRVSVFVSNLVRRGRIVANKGFGHALMSVQRSNFSIYVGANSEVPFAVFPKGAYVPPFSVGLTSTPLHSPVQTTDSTVVTNLVDTLVSGDGTPLFVTDITSHDKAPVFCIQVRGNHNMYVGLSKQFSALVSNCMIIDDPHDASTVNSDLQRQTVLDTYDNKLSTRLNSQTDSVIILIMQRLHSLDLTGHLLQKTKTKWVHVVMPMHYDSSYTYDAAKDLNKPELNDPRKENELLFPAIFSKSVVGRLEEDLGSYAGAGQLEQRPSPKGGGILKEEWFRVLNKDEELPVCDHIFISCDTAYSEKDMKTNSYSAFTTWGVFWNKHKQRDCVLLLDVWFEQVDYPKLRKKAKEMWEDKKPDVFLIEKKASGASLVQDLRQARISVRTYTPTTDKIARAYAVQSMLESGLVWIPDRNWAHRFTHLMSTFPTGAAESNDLADTLTQALVYIRNGWYVSHPDDEDEKEIPQEFYSAYGSRLQDQTTDQLPSRFH